MELQELGFNCVYEILLNPFKDDRGIFTRTFDEAMFRELGITNTWVQENYTKNNKKGTIRGLHFLLFPDTDGKLIRCTRGKIWDVIVDLRKGSQHFGNWISAELSESEEKWILIPKGFAHGYCTLSDNADLIYRHDTYYNKKSDSGILWNDRDLNISWPVDDPLISEKDKNLMKLDDFVKIYGGL